MSEIKPKTTIAINTTLKDELNQIRLHLSYKLGGNIIKWDDFLQILRDCADKELVKRLE